MAGMLPTSSFRMTQKAGSGLAKLQPNSYDALAAWGSLSCEGQLLGTLFLLSKMSPDG